MPSGETIKLLGAFLTAWLIIGMGFYALVIYDFALPELIQGAFISLMTLAANWVFADQLASAVARRAQTAFESGMSNTPTVTTTAGPPPAVTVAPPTAGAEAPGVASSVYDETITGT